MAGSLPLPVFTGPVEPFAPYAPPTKCELTSPRPGVVAFRDWVLGRVGGRDLGIGRPCASGAASHHHEARAWDWGMVASEPAERAAVDAFLAWLLGPGPSGEAAELARRAGIEYVIWDRRIWRSSSPSWSAYDGYNADGACTVVAPASCRDPHTNHVHFSFSWDGALGKTSFYRWLDAGAPDTGVVPVPQPSGSGKRTAVALLAFAAGLGITVPWARGRRRGR